MSQVSIYKAYKQVYLNDELRTLGRLNLIYGVSRIDICRILTKYYPEHHNAAVNDMQYYLIENGAPVPAFIFRHVKEAMDLFFAGEIQI